MPHRCVIMSLSPWQYVILEAPTPITVYVYAVLAFLIVGGLGFWLMRKAENEGEPEELAA